MVCHLICPFVHLDTHSSGEVKGGPVRSSHHGGVGACKADANSNIPCYKDSSWMSYGLISVATPWCSLMYSGAYLGVCQHRVTIHQANGIWLRRCMRLKELIDGLVCRKVCQGIVVFHKHEFQVSLRYKRQIQCHLIRALGSGLKKHLQDQSCLTGKSSCKPRPSCFNPAGIADDVIRYLVFPS